MDLKEEDEEHKQLFLVDTPRDPLVSAGAIVATVSAQEDINPGDLQTSVLAGLMGAQSSSVCFPTKFSKFCLSVYNSCTVFVQSPVTLLRLLWQRSLE